MYTRSKGAKCLKPDRFSPRSCSTLDIPLNGLQRKPGCSNGYPVNPSQSNWRHQPNDPNRSGFHIHQKMGCPSMLSTVFWPIIRQLIQCYHTMLHPDAVWRDRNAEIDHTVILRQVMKSIGKRVRTSIPWVTSNGKMNT